MGHCRPELAIFGMCWLTEPTHDHVDLIMKTRGIGYYYALQAD